MIYINAVNEGNEQPESKKTNTFDSTNGTESSSFNERK